jgi:hypothetical protein
MRTKLETLRDAWAAAWPKALALWSPYARLREPRLVAMALLMRFTDFSLAQIGRLKKPTKQSGRPMWTL